MQCKLGKPAQDVNGKWVGWITLEKMSQCCCELFSHSDADANFMGQMFLLNTDKGHLTVRSLVCSQPVTVATTSHRYWERVSHPNTSSSHSPPFCFQKAVEIMCLKNAQETKNSTTTNNNQPTSNNHLPTALHSQTQNATWRSSTSHVDNVGSPVLCCSSWSRCLVAPMALQALGASVEIDKNRVSCEFRFEVAILYGEVFLRDIYPSRNTIYIYTLGVAPFPGCQWPPGWHV